MTKSGWKFFLVVLFICALVISLDPILARAQSGFELFFDPAQVSLDKGDTETIGIKVINGSNVNAYDLTVIYDEEIVALSSWAHGDYLSNLAIVFSENAPGQFHIAVTQLATPAVSGDGLLLNLSFKGEMPGVTTLIFQDTEFYSPQGIAMSPELSEGVVIVATVPSATKTIHPTLTSSPFYTFTPTRTLTPSNTLTRTPKFTVTGVQTDASFHFSETESFKTSPDLTEVVVNTSDSISVISTGMPDLFSAFASTDSDSPLVEERPQPVDHRKTDSQSLLNIILWSFASFLIIAILALTYLLFVRKRRI